MSLRLWHRWFGLTVLPILLVACVSGVLMVYQKAIVRTLVTPGAQLPPGYDIQTAADELQRLIDHPAFLADALIKAPNSQEPYWSLRHADGRRQLLSLGDLQVYQQGDGLLSAFEFVRELHIELLTGLAGEMVLLVIGFSALFLSVTGIWLWWPMRKAFKWQWVVPPPSHWQSKWWLRYHSHSGSILVPILLLVFITSSVMMWQKVRNALTTIEAPPVKQSTLKPAADEISRALLLADATVGNSWPTYIRVTPGSPAKVRIRVRLNGEWHPNGRTNILIDLNSQTVENLQRADAAFPLQKILNQMYPLHSGYGMPAIYTLLIFLAGVGGAWLSVTGALSYLRVLRQRRTPKARADWARESKQPG